jgi:hypothetical protein
MTKTGGALSAFGAFFFVLWICFGLSGCAGSKDRASDFGFLRSAFGFRLPMQGLPRQHHPFVTPDASRFDAIDPDQLSV